ncbi:arginine--tRNA ligase [Subtercola boreus]|uniref:Arginine--tRNA ligase n=1 Tax=Subtercola boreus TaxID=120213 RepID=A0A3E0W9R2_9MICO|nr:arginine--tRNA ligase [Subtercola boreus]RFA20366.1 arginine--tRNA ligase [Subtercola boreus]RFA20520.1 arginine--tRNA ligase [Subtercola boreus]RFA26769.1 arginine--tRNA ligase [Subtercola boreus]
MTPEDLSSALFDIVGDRLRLRGDDVSITLGDVLLERPRNRDHGDWTSNIAMKLAKRLGTNPRAFAAELLPGIEAIDGVASVDVAGPGFINITLDTAAAGEIVRSILNQGDRYGHTTVLDGLSVNMEFVSANPTGPLHLGHTRWAALGDAIARVLTASGAEVTTEYYINDAGNQMDNFGASILAAAKGEPTPENGYPGEYVQALAAHVLEKAPDLLTLPHDDAIALARDLGYLQQLDEIKTSLENFNVHFDVYFSERSLHVADPETGRSLIDDAAVRLAEQGHVFEKDDAVWVRTTDFGDDKDRVLTRGNGVTTYFAADAAYYLNKKDRGFTEKIYLLGADHHGYVGRLKALAAAAGDDPDVNITVLIGQLVNLNGAKLSKRAGNIVELDDLLNWVGADALRYSLARYPADSPLSLDGEKLRERTNDNPVFYVQYAHSRTRSVAKNAEAAGVDRSAFEPSLLTHETETELLGSLQELPRVVAQSAELREPHRVARYLEEVAGHYHRWYASCRVLPLGDEAVTDLHRTRLWLNDATGQVIRNGLALLGVSAPDRM